MRQSTQIRISLPNLNRITGPRRFLRRLFLDFAEVRGRGEFVLGISSLPSYAWIQSYITIITDFPTECKPFLKISCLHRYSCSKRLPQRRSVQFAQRSASLVCSQKRSGYIMINSSQISQTTIAMMSSERG